MIKFLTRKHTEGVRLSFREGDMSLMDLVKQAKRSGRLHLGYHYVLHKNGTISKGIDDAFYADYTLPHHQTSLYILVMGGHLNDAQQHALQRLLDDLNLNLIKED